MNIPTLITLARILAVPVTVWLIAAGDLAPAFVLFVLAGITDGIDGYLARRWNQRTTLGAYLDAIADKALLVSIYVTLAITGDIPRWLAIAVVSRDVMIVGAVILSWVLSHPVKIRPLFVSKANTALQIVFAAMVLGLGGLDLAEPALVFWGAVAVAALTVASAGAYLVQWVRHMAGFEENREV